MEQPETFTGYSWCKEIAIMKLVDFSDGKIKKEIITARIKKTVLKKINLVIGVESSFYKTSKQCTPPII
jgi:hypothetical protein